MLCSGGEGADSPPLRCGLCMLTSCQRAQQEMGEEGDFTVRQRTAVTSAIFYITAKSHTDGMCPGRSVMRTLYLCGLSPIPPAQSNHEKNTKSHLQVVLQTPDQSASKPQGHPNQENPRNRLSPETPKETVNKCHMKCRDGKRVLGETEEICINYGPWLMVIISTLVH